VFVVAVVYQVILRSVVPNIKFKLDNKKYRLVADENYFRLYYDNELLHELIKDEVNKKRLISLVGDLQRKAKDKNIVVMKLINYKIIKEIDVEF
jgi:hypothetical protein